MGMSGLTSMFRRASDSLKMLPSKLTVSPLKSDLIMMMVSRSA